MGSYPVLIHDVQRRDYASHIGVFVETIEVCNKCQCGTDACHFSPYIVLDNPCWLFSQNWRFSTQLVLSRIEKHWPTQMTHEYSWHAMDTSAEDEEPSGLHSAKEAMLSRCCLMALLHRRCTIQQKHADPCFFPDLFASFQDLQIVRPNPDVAPHLQSSWSMIMIIIIIVIITITSSHHHIMIIITLKFATPSEQYVDWGNNINFIFMKGSKFATPSEQYVDWGNNINFIFMRGQNSPPPLNNMLTGVITPTISPWGIKIRHPLWTICWLG